MKILNAFRKSSIIDLGWSDEVFDGFLYPEAIKGLSSVHWTPIEIAKRASEWLAPVAGTQVLDIGSGVGKFCIVGALHRQGHFTGVEHRKHLFNRARKASQRAQVKNVEFLLADMISIDFGLFDSFYLFNPFYENMVPYLAIDRNVELSDELYRSYQRYVYTELDRMKTGTRVAIYCGTDSKIPPSYELVHRLPEDERLRFWIKR